MQRKMLYRPVVVAKNFSNAVKIHTNNRMKYRGATKGERRTKTITKMMWKKNAHAERNQKIKRKSFFVVVVDIFKFTVQHFFFDYLYQQHYHGFLVCVWRLFAYTRCDMSTSSIRTEMWHFFLLKNQEINGAAAVLYCNVCTIIFIMLETKLKEYERKKENKYMEREWKRPLFITRYRSRLVRINLQTIFIVRSACKCTKNNINWSCKEIICVRCILLMDGKFLFN